MSICDLFVVADPNRFAWPPGGAHPCAMGATVQAMQVAFTPTRPLGKRFQV
ncbi:hypothetical protein [Mycobacterium sp.]|uniref:hypothetical protein n=1 Tax=Mycobacterium sp. TaxID=1785 RepID=UPI002BD2ECE4|nr:hypothetical protein [Mycobacterium sp.]HTH90359.1 hypothetical protein [Mycobacterium sp.]